MYNLISSNLSFPSVKWGTTTPQSSAGCSDYTWGRGTWSMLPGMGHPRVTPHWHPQTLALAAAAPVVQTYQHCS